MLCNILSASILISGAFYLAYLYLYSLIDIHDSEWGSKVFLYQENDGNIQNIEGIIKSLSENVAPSNLNHDSFLTILPNNSDPKENKILTGIVLDTKDKTLAQNFVKTHSNFNIAEISGLSTVTSGRFPYVGPLSSLWLNYILYPKLWDYGERNRIFTKENTLATIQMYYKTQDKTKLEIEVLVPHGNSKIPLLLKNTNSTVNAKKNKPKKDIDL